MYPHLPRLADICISYSVSAGRGGVPDGFHLESLLIPPDIFQMLFTDLGIFDGRYNVLAVEYLRGNMEGGSFNLIFLTVIYHVQRRAGFRGVEYVSVELLKVIKSCMIIRSVT